MFLHPLTGSSLRFGNFCWCHEGFHYPQPAPYICIISHARNIIDPFARNFKPLATCTSNIEAFFNWCVPRYLPASPCVGIKMEAQPTRERVLSDEELKRVWIAATRMGYPFGTIVQLLILTGQRRSEIGKLHRNYVKNDRIVLPAAFVKNGREHVFPLAPLAKSLIPVTGNSYLFRAAGLEVPYSGYAFHMPLLHTYSETSGWTPHDLRRTFATNLAAMGTPIHVTEKVLNHVSGSISGVAAIYNRHTYFEEMGAALVAWEERLQGLLK